MLQSALAVFPVRILQNFAGSVITCDTGTAVDGAVAGPVDVVVTNPDGTVTTLVSGFTYTDGIGYPMTHAIPQRHRRDPLC